MDYIESDFLDSVILKDFEVRACHGVNPEEKTDPQRFLFTAEVYLDISAAAKYDDIAQTVSYSAVKKCLKSFCENNRFDLIETLAVRSAQEILLDFPLAKRVELTIKKPDAPMSGVFDHAAVRVKRAWHTAYLSLGSNLGDRNDHLDFAVSELKKRKGIKNVTESSRITTLPYGGVADEDFINGAVKIETFYSPYELLEIIGEIEREGGRIRKERWGNRTLDIDVIFYDRIVLGDEKLCIPHRDMQNRLFVLRPLNELCPDYVHPLLNKRVSELYFALSTVKK